MTVRQDVPQLNPDDNEKTEGSYSDYVDIIICTKKDLYYNYHKKLMDTFVTKNNIYCDKGYDNEGNRIFRASVNRNNIADSIIQQFIRDITNSAFNREDDINNYVMYVCDYNSEFIVIRHGNWLDNPFNIKVFNNISYTLYPSIND